MAEDKKQYDPSASQNGYRPDMEEAPPKERPRFDHQALAELLINTPRLAMAMKREPDADNVRHDLYDTLLAEAGLKAQWSEEAIIDLINEANVRNSRPILPQEYCKLVIQAARLKTKTGNLDFAREQLLDSLSETWGIDIRAVIRHGTENALWHLRLVNGEEIRLGSSEDLMSQAKVRARIFDVVGHVIPRYTPKDARLWDHHLSILALVAVTVDTPEMTRIGQARSLVLGYLETEYCPLDHDTSSEEWEGVALSNKPFMRNGQLHLAARHMWMHWVRIVDPKMSQTELLDALRLLGGRRVTVAIDHPKHTSRSVWRLSPAHLQEGTSEGDPLIPLTGFNLEETTND